MNRKPHGWSGQRLAKIALLVSGFQHAAVLHDHTDFAGKLQHSQQLLHSRREHFSRADLTPKLYEPPCLIFGLYVAGH
jgi:hypothetical protein